MRLRVEFLKRPFAPFCVSVVFVVAGGGCEQPRDDGSNPPPSRTQSDSASNLNTSPPASVGFRLDDVSKASGVRFEMSAGTQGRYFFPAVMSGGVALFDFDRDGDLDLLLVGGAPSRDGKQPPLRLYRQDKPWTFRDVTPGSGLKIDGFAMGVAIGDVNNDGKPDVYVTCYGSDRLFLGRGDGTFADVTVSSGIDNPAWGASACFVDYDRDGRLDLYVTNYVNYFPDKQCFDEVGKEDFCGPQVFFPTTDRLFRNVSEPGAAAGGGVRFQEVTVRAGIAKAKGAGLGVIAADFNDDGWPDLYVANDGTPNFLWINRKDGTFREEAALRGVATNRLGNPQAGMGVAMGDVNGDGHDELLITHLAGEMNALYSRKDGVWREAASESGLGAAGFVKTGFGTALFDLNFDGELDAVVVNGRVKRDRTERRKVGSSGTGIWSAYAEENQVFVNQGGGRFQLAAVDGPFCTAKDASRGLAVGDIDNDGDLDLVVVNAGAPARLYRNESKRSGNWVMIRAVDRSLGGRDMLGAVVTVRCGGRRWSGTVRTASSYLSANDPRVHFGLGRCNAIDAIDVRWPDGRTQSFPGGKVNRHITVERRFGPES